ncbi:rRNA processing protein [Mycoemilia scoparia]|uniref:Pre-rRNA-processing protein n=1 Tax=Mycoemilia scoparia TaxID=417184 RepID=A0A9W8A3M2_9FUNG|nr:rRNA processing protein [Mycoemilia scoparia]
MPKASKKKKQEKAQDFKKVKLKVGKKKAPANNFTDTSFQSKSIVLSTQSISIDKSSELTNTRNHTLKELLVQIKHFSPSVRKDAIMGLRDLLTQHPTLLDHKLGDIINSTAKLMIDNEHLVRKTCQSLYEYMLESMSESDFAPFVSIIVAFVCAGMTHILDDIRADALKFLDMLVPLIPNSLGNYADSIMPNFFSLLNTSDGKQGGGGFSVNTQSHMLSQKHRLTILKACCNYMKTCVNIDQTISFEGFWFMPTSVNFVSQNRAALRIWSDPETCNGPITINSLPYFDQSAPKPYVYLNLFSDSTLSNEDVKSKSSGSNSARNTLLDDRSYRKLRYSQALSKLYPFLQACWVELAPPIFGAVSKIPNSDGLNTCHFITDILRLLWRTSEPDFNKMSVSKLLIDMNLAVAELLCLFTTSYVPAAESKSANELSKWRPRLLSFIQNTLGVQASGKKDGNQTMTSVHFKGEQLLELLPTIWRLYSEGAQKDQQGLLKALSIEFLFVLMKLLTDNAFGQKKKPNEKSSTAIVTQDLAEWLMGLPKLLWQLKSNQPKTTEVVLRTLLMLFQRQEHVQLDKKLIDGLQASLVPFFYVEVPNKGPVYGPFVNLPGELQRLAIKVLYYSPNGPSEKILAALESCFENIAKTGKPQEIAQFARVTLCMA